MTWMHMSVQTHFSSFNVCITAWIISITWNNCAVPILCKKRTCNVALLDKTQPWPIITRTECYVKFFCPGNEHPSFGNIVNRQLLVALPDNSIRSVCMCVLKCIGRVHCGFIIFNTNHEWHATPNAVNLLFMFMFVVSLFDTLFDNKLNNVMSSLISENYQVTLVWCFIVL